MAYMRETRTLQHRVVSIGGRLVMAILLAASLAATRGAVHAGTGVTPQSGDEINARRSLTYLQTNLVSDGAVPAAHTDANLKNPWGITFSPTSPFWISDNGAGVSTLYNGAGVPFPPATPLIVTIPPAKGSPAGTTGTPTGVVFNGSSGFVVTGGGGGSGPSLFIFATEDGTISGWNPTADLHNAILEVPGTGASAVYKGLAIGTAGTGTFLYATNFRAGTIDVFDSTFKPVTLGSPAFPGTFSDPLSTECPLPGQCFAPFGIRNIGGLLYVTYALQKPDKHDDQAGPGNGFVDIFTTSGVLVQRLLSGGPLNSPWGLALAPAGQGAASNKLLVGNFGDGRITVVVPGSGAVLGQLTNVQGGPLTIDGLWSLTFGNGFNGGDADKLYFTAGINGEQDGLFGSLTFVPGVKGSPTGK